MQRGLKWVSEQFPKLYPIHKLYVENNRAKEKITCAVCGQDFVTFVDAALPKSELQRIVDHAVDCKRRYAKVRRVAAAANRKAAKKRAENAAAKKGVKKSAKKKSTKKTPSKKSTKKAKKKAAK